MRQLARAGWDTFTLDLEGFGSSTRPPIMDDPTAAPGVGAPIRGDVTVLDVKRVVEFINALRGTRQVHLLGWSQGATLEAPRFSIAHPEMVAKLVLVGTRDDDPRSMEERRRAAAEGEAQKVRHSAQTVQRWGALGTKEEWLVPGCLDSVAQAYLASDPKSGELGGMARVPAGRQTDLDLSKPHFQAARITMPTLVIRGDGDTYATRENNQRMVAALGSTVKEFVEIPNAGHFLQFEKANAQFYQALLSFLERK
jgi:pimeloyl-ACP methyl ester carboxylesterase